ncbi:MAG: hypothetical protein LBR68_04005, partial [Lachnoclostridium sp.]|nr:hypothetical protein [Lachnoclostridium sp.]
MKKLQKVLARALACAMVFGLIASAAPIISSAAKKPALSPKKATIKVGAKRKITLKNAKKAKKTKWSVKPKKAVQLSKKTKNSVTVKGLKAAKRVTLTAKFKLGKKNSTAKMTITVTKNDVKPTPKPSSAAPAPSAVAPSVQPSSAPGVSSSPTVSGQPPS